MDNKYETYSIYVESIEQADLLGLHLENKKIKYYTETITENIVEVEVKFEDVKKLCELLVELDINQLNSSKK